VTRIQVHASSPESLAALARAVAEANAEMHVDLAITSSTRERLTLLTYLDDLPPYRPANAALHFLEPSYVQCPYRTSYRRIRAWPALEWRRGEHGLALASLGAIDVEEPSIVFALEDTEGTEPPAFVVAEWLEVERDPR
jgi:hypothetical protein